MIRNIFYSILFISMYTSLGAQETNYLKRSTGVTAGGIYYELYSNSTGGVVKEGQILKINMVQKLNDSVAFDSYRGIPSYFAVVPSMPYEFSELFPLLRKGDSIYFVQLVDTFIRRNPEMVNPSIRKGDSVKNFVKIVEAFGDEKMAEADYVMEKEKKLQQEIAEIAKKLKQENINAFRTPLGVFVETIKPGTGSNIDSSSSVTVNYSMKLFDGKVVDSNTDSAFGHIEPLVFTVGSGQMIAGLGEAMLFLKKGAVARLYIPSLLAYGASPTPPVLPFSNLLFEITVLDVKKTTKGN